MADNYWVNNWENIVKKGKKPALFLKIYLISCTQKVLKFVVFSLSGSLIDVKNVHERLNIIFFLKTSLFYVKVGLFQKLVFYRLKSFQN